MASDLVNQDKQIADIRTLTHSTGRTGNSFFEGSFEGDWANSWCRKWM